MWACDPGLSCDGGLDVALCMQVARHECEQGVASVAGDLDAGRITWHGDRARTCLDAYADYMAAIRPMICGDFAAYYAAVYGQRSCANGLESWDGGMATGMPPGIEECGRVLVGHVTNGQACASDGVCVSL